MKMGCIHGFGLHTEDAGVFCRTQWGFPWIIWLVYRLLFALYYLGGLGFILISSLITQPSAAVYFFIYLTDWTVLVVAVYLVVAVINMVIDRKHGMRYHTTRASRGDIRIDLRFRHKLQWMLLNVYMNVSILVTVIYRSFFRGPIPILLDLTLHAFPCVLGFIDVIMTPIPVKLQHAVYPMAYGLLYILFTVIYWAAGGTDPNGNTGIYPGLLDWEDPVTTCITIACSLVAVCVSQVILWGVYQLKMVMIRRCCSFLLHRSVEQDQDALNANTQEGVDEQERGTFYENAGFYSGNDINMTAVNAKE